MRQEALLPEVSRDNTRVDSVDSVDPVDSVPSYETLRSAMDAFFEQLNQYKKAAYAARVEKRALSGAQAPAVATVNPHIMFSTVDRPNPQTSSLYHTRYTPTVWYDNGHRQDPPPIMR
ncbi:hypothetical protein DFQ26_003074, partial [Actinomortierella ambigua]